MEKPDGSELEERDSGRKKNKELHVCLVQISQGGSCMHMWVRKLSNLMFLLFADAYAYLNSITACRQNRLL